MVGSLARRIVRGIFIATIIGMLGASGAALVRDIAHRHQKPKVLGKTLVKSSPTPTPKPTGPIFSVPPQGPPIVQSSSEAPEPAQPAPAPVVSSCHNSTVASCGHFYWSPSPGSNAGFSIQIEWFPSNPDVGDDVAFTLTATDPDALVTHHFENYGDTGGSPTHVDCFPARYGPWTPPARERGTLHQVFHHAYGSAGNFTARFSVQSGACGNPYGSLGSIDVPLTVTAASTPEPTPSPTESP